MANVIIPHAEHGIIRVFAISRPMVTMARALKQQNKAALASALLGHDVTLDDIELFALADLAGIGLYGYLSEGYDLDREALRRDRVRLEALDGYVLLLFSRVSLQGPVTLVPHSDITLIGTYARARAKSAAPPLTTPSAELYSGVKRKPDAARRSRVGSAITATATLLIILILWWILR